MSPIVLAIPIFFALIAVELGVALALGRSLYRTNDSIADLSCGVLHQLLGVFTQAFIVGTYVWTYEAFHALELSASAPWVWGLGFVLTDFFYYWFHRKSHEVNALWAAHIVHHQSEEFNLSVALRQGALQPMFAWIFYLPLALLGVPPAVFLLSTALNTLYQFWIHTRLIRTLGPLEWVLNTPSHHRVHHGRNRAYHDTNYGGVFIVWDRWFGTFVPEGEEVVYGVTEAVDTWNPLAANLDYWRRMWGWARAARAPLAALLTIPFRRPGYRPEGTPPDPPSRGLDAPKFDLRQGRAVDAYVLVQFGIATGLTVFLLRSGAELSTASELGIAVFVAASLAVFGGLFEGRRWARWLEPARLVALAAVMFHVFHAAPSG